MSATDFPEFEISDDDLPVCPKSNFEAMSDYYVDKVLTATPQLAKNLMQRHGLILAGGFIRDIVNGDEPADVDLFVPETSDVRAKAAARELFGSVAEESENSYTIPTAHPLRVVSKKTLDGEMIHWPLSLKLSIIWRWARVDACELIDGFDFVCCKAAIWYDSQQAKFVGLEHSDFRHQAYNKILRFDPHGSVRDSAAASVKRLHRFAARGYNWEHEELMKIVYARYDEIHEASKGMTITPSVMRLQFFQRGDGTAISGSSR